MRFSIVLRAFGAVLCISTAITVPAHAADAFFGPGIIVGPITVGPGTTFYSSASLNSGSYGFQLDGFDTATQAGSISATASGIFFSVPIGMLINSGTIEAGSNGIYADGTLDHFTNTATGVIKGHPGVYLTNRALTVTNDGLISATAQSSSMGIVLNGGAGTLINRGTIEARDVGVSMVGNVDRFENFGKITGDQAVTGYRVDSFINRSTGSIIGVTEGVTFLQSQQSFQNFGAIRGGTMAVDTQQLGDFLNAGSITSTGTHGIRTIGSVTGTFSNTGTIEAGQYGVYVSQDVATFSNSGSITASDDLGGQNAGVYISGSVASFINEAGATIQATNDSVGVRVNTQVTSSFVNRGTISAGTGAGVSFGWTTASFENTGTIEGGSNGLLADGIGVFRNSGTIVSSTGAGVRGSVAGHPWENSGTIRGVTGLVTFATSADGLRLINSGTIEGTGGTAIDFNSTGTYNDTLVLQGHGRVIGSVLFGGGADTLDVAGYTGGSTVLTVDSVESLLAGSILVRDQRDGAGTGTVSIVDGTAIRSSGSAVLGSVSRAISEEISGTLSSITGTTAVSVPMGYAPARPMGAAEVATDALVASAAPVGPEIWGNAFGGVTGKAGDYGTVFGGIISGSHVAVDRNARLGGVVSVAGSRFATANNGQSIESAVASLGLYGSTSLDAATLSYSVIGGVAANHSSRTVLAMVTETARADFASWYWSPELGLSIPVLVLDGVDTSAGVRLRYVGGGFGSYTETGSSQNLTVGASSLNLLDARVELTATSTVASNDFGDVTLSGTSGVMALHNFGSSVSVAGFPLATTAAGTALGVYGDVTLEAPVGLAAKASASAGVEVRTDAVSSASANLGLSASF